MLSFGLNMKHNNSIAGYFIASILYCNWEINISSPTDIKPATGGRGWTQFNIITLVFTQYPCYFHNALPPINSSQRHSLWRSYSTALPLYYQLASVKYNSSQAMTKVQIAPLAKRRHRQREGHFMYVTSPLRNVCGGKNQIPTLWSKWIVGHPHTQSER